MEKGRKYWNPIVQNSHFSFLFFIFQLCCLLFIFLIFLNWNLQAFLLLEKKTGLQFSSDMLG
jgi:hypothetical protein